jgi:ABC-type branched-subunit amino acid transport system permease subunit
MTTIIATVLALSFVVLTGFGGQTSLAQMAFAGVAGFTLSKIAMNTDIPFPAAPLLAALVAAVFGVVVGLPALRLRGTNLAIVTLAGGVAISEFIFKNPTFVGDSTTGGAKVPAPQLGDWNLGLVLGTKSSRPVFGLFLLVVATVVALLVANLRKSSTGRRLLAVRSNERAAAAAGIDVSRVKLLTFAMSAFIAGIAGTLIAYRFGSVSDASFGVVASLTALAVAYLGGITSVSGAVTSGILATSGVAFFATSRVFDAVGQWEVFVGGLLLILTAILNPEGVAGGIRMSVAEARAKKRAARPPAEEPEREVVGAQPVGG